jgi:hypothetical protein
MEGLGKELGDYSDAKHAPTEYLHGNQGVKPVPTRLFVYTASISTWGFIRTTPAANASEMTRVGDAGGAVNAEMKKPTAKGGLF